MRENADLARSGHGRAEHAMTGVAVCGLAAAAMMRMSTVAGPAVRSTTCLGWKPGMVGVAGIGAPASVA